MAAAEIEGVALGVAGVVDAGLGDAAAEQAAIAIASAGTRRVMDRFMTDDVPSSFGLDVVLDLADSSFAII
jgi:hypothetical protein